MTSRVREKNNFFFQDRAWNFFVDVFQTWIDSSKMDDGGEDDVIVAESSDIFTMWGKKISDEAKAINSPLFTSKDTLGMQSNVWDRERERERDGERMRK